MEEIHKAGLTGKNIPISEKLAEKKFRTHKIKTDTGIKINFSLSFYDNKEKIEFVNNSDCFAVCADGIRRVWYGNAKL